MAESLRRAWNAESYLTESERWVSVLRDDKSKPGVWLQACQYLVSPSDEIRRGNTVWRSKNPKALMKGAPLQAKHGKEITELMARRAIQVAKLHERSSLDVHTCADSLRIGCCLAKWARAGSSKTLVDLTKLAQATMDQWKTYDEYIVQDIAEPYARLMSDRMLLGDRSAIDDYEVLLPHTHIRSFISAGVFRPFWTMARDADMAVVSRKFMAGQADRLNSSDSQVALSMASYFVRRTLDSPLLINPDYRRALVSGFSNSTVAGEAWSENYAGGGESLRYDFKNGGSGGMGTGKAQSGQPTGKHFSVTIGDHLAQLVSNIKGAPEFCMVWPVERRNTARAKLIEWLLDDRRDWLAVGKASPFFDEEF